MTSIEESSQIHFPDKTTDGLSDYKELQQSIQDVTLAFEILPPRFREELWTHPECLELIELVMDYGRPPIARFPTGDFPLSEETIDFTDLDSAIESVGEFSDDNRTGIEGTLHRVSCMRDRHDRIYGLTIRLGRAITTETAGLVIDPLASGQSALLLGPPDVGKTTAIRSFCRLLADVLKKRVVIVDTLNEIAGHGLIPHPAVGSSRRMKVKHRADQHHVMMEAVQNHRPEVIVIDEIGTKEECEAFKSISQRGVQLLATTNARTLEDMIKDPVLRELVGGISNVIIGEERASQTEMNKKTVLERANACSFNIIVEMTARTHWRIHYDADSAVDAILAGDSPRAEIRYLDEEGNMFMTDEVQGSNVLISQQTCVDMKKSFVNPEQTHEKANITQSLLHKPEETKQEKIKIALAEALSVLQSNAGSDNASTSTPLLHSETTLTSKQVILNKDRPNEANLHNAEFTTNNIALLYSEQLDEAKRILNASSYLEAFQVRRYPTKHELDVALASLRSKLARTWNEDKIIREARVHVHKLYTKLLPKEEKKKTYRERNKKKEQQQMNNQRFKEHNTRHEAGPSNVTEDTTDDMHGAITVEKWVVNL